MKVLLDDGAYLPERAHSTDAGLDLRSRETVMIWPGAAAVFGTGVHIQFNPGTWGKVESKSGLNVNHSVVSCGGVIDEGYTGEIRVKLYNLGREAYTVHEGDKIAQLVILPYLTPDMEQVTQLDETERGTAGFGSTGR